MRITQWQPAPAGTRFAQEAFNPSIGHDAPLKIKGVQRGHATVVAADVAEDGSGVTWTFDIPDET